MSNYPKVARGCALFAAATLLLSGCAAGAPTDADDSTTLRVQVSQGDSNPEIGQAWIDGFMAANPGVEVEMELISQDALKSTNLSVLTGANPPDVGLIQVGTSGYQALVADGGFMTWPVCGKRLNLTLDTRKR